MVRHVKSDQSSLETTNGFAAAETVAPGVTVLLRRSAGWGRADRAVDTADHLDDIRHLSFEVGNWCQDGEDEDTRRPDAAEMAGCVFRAGKLTNFLPTFPFVRSLAVASFQGLHNHEAKPSSG